MTDKPQKKRTSLPWKTRLFISAASTVAEAAQRRDGTINRRLLSLFDVRSPPTPIPINGVASSDHTVNPANTLSFRLFSPADSSRSAPRPVIVFFHGGGFVLESAFSRTFDALCRRLSKQAASHVVSVEYRRAPEHRHPAAYEDGVEVLQWLDSNVDLIADLSAVFLSGDSAGGNIAHHVARTAASVTFSRLTIVGLVLLQPFFGGEEDTESEKRLNGKVPFGSREQMKWMWRAFLPAGASLDHEAANVFGPGSSSHSENWEGFPATMVVVGGRDTLQDRQRWYAQGLVDAGVDVCTVEFPNAVHGFYVFPELADADKVLVDVDEFVKQQLESQKNLSSVDS